MKTKTWAWYGALVYKCWRANKCCRQWKPFWCKYCIANLFESMYGLFRHLFFPLCLSWWRNIGTVQQVDDDLGCTRWRICRNMNWWTGNTFWALIYLPNQFMYAESISPLFMPWDIWIKLNITHGSGINYLEGKINRILHGLGPQ